MHAACLCISDANYIILSGDQVGKQKVSEIVHVCTRKMLVDKFLDYVMDLSPSTTSNLQQAYTLQHRKFILHESEKVFIAE